MKNSHDLNPAELVAETFPFDGGRGVTVWMPDKTPEAIVYAADGQELAKWGNLLVDPSLPPTMIIGVHSLTDELMRLNEYSPVFDRERFEAHEHFFAEDVRNWVVSKLGIDLPTERTAILGTSAGGELALALGLRHPNLYGTILCASPGAGFKPPLEIRKPIPRTYLVAGAQEPFFLENARVWADALGQAGADVVMQERHGEHGGVFWQQEFPLMVKWAFSRNTR